MVSLASPSGSDTELGKDSSRGVSHSPCPCYVGNHYGPHLLQDKAAAMYSGVLQALRQVPVGPQSQCDFSLATCTEWSPQSEDSHLQSSTVAAVIPLVSTRRRHPQGKHTAQLLFVPENAHCGSGLPWLSGQREVWTGDSAISPSPSSY